MNRLEWLLIITVVTLAAKNFVSVILATIFQSLFKKYIHKINIECTVVIFYANVF